MKNLFLKLNPDYCYDLVDEVFLLYMSTNFASVSDNKKHDIIELHRALLKYFTKKDAELAEEMEKAGLEKK